MLLNEFLNIGQFKEDLKAMTSKEFTLKNDYLIYYFNNLVNGSEVMRYVSYTLDDFGEVGACVVEDDGELCIFKYIQKSSPVETVNYKGKIEVKKYPSGIFKDPKWYFLRCKDADLADKLRDAPTDDLVRQYIEHLKKFYSFEYGLSDTKRIGDIRARQYVVYRYILFFSNTPLGIL